MSISWRPGRADRSPSTTAAGTAVALQLSATDPNADPLQYAVTGLPAGLNIAAATGLVSGSPTAAGTFDVVVSASDGVNTASATFVWTVNSATPLTPT